jgi:NAD-dependent deacetylase
MRPHIVWFGEDVPLIQEAAELISECDVLVIIGTSLVVYPAAGLMAFAPDNAQIFYIDKNPNLEFIRKKNIKIMQGSASDCLRELKF